jgi:septal ring factor EnvC (AmiA/AmiB activator)
MKSIVKTVKGRGRPKGSKNKAVNTSDRHTALYPNEKSAGSANLSIGTANLIDFLEKEVERKDHTLEIMRDEIRELEKLIKDQKEKNAFLELDIGHLKDIIKRLVEHL